jgi:hypothetical protein
MRAKKYLRDEALLLLSGEGQILDTARELTGLLDESGIEGAIIGGVAVVLHGHVRTTNDVDVFVADPDTFADSLRAAGFRFHKARREFVKSGVPVHLVLEDQLGTAPANTLEIDGIRTVSLADLINMKLRSGLKSLVRAQDLADVLGLIRARRLSPQFAARLDKDLRSEFRKLRKALQSQR